MRIRVSIEGQLALLAVCLVAASLALALVFHRLTDDWTTTVVLALALAVPVAIWAARRWAGPVGRLMRALNDGFTSLRDGEFSVSLASNRRDELGELVSNYNAVGDVLRRERQDLFQRELLLDTVIQSTPLALVLTSGAGHVIYSNTVARQMFRDGARLEGHVFEALVSETPASLQDAGRGRASSRFSCSSYTPKCCRRASRKEVCVRSLWRSAATIASSIVSVATNRCTTTRRV